jgi:hypothetical protein
MKHWIQLLVVGLLLASCEKNINFDLDEAEVVLVVDAQIENGRPPVVVLTKSFSFFQQLDAAAINNSFVRNASVRISNGTQTHLLKEDSIAVIPGIFAYFYSNDPSNPATAFNGALDGRYTMNIESEGKTYTASTSIPRLALFPDSIWFERAPFNVDTTRRVMFMRATDPAGRGDYFRYFTRVNNDIYYPGLNVFDDQVLDGTTFQISLPRGINRNIPFVEDSLFYRRTDTVTLKFCKIDQQTHRFWNTWEFAFSSIGNPFAQPNKVLGNISNGALGVFCGYAAAYKTFIVP